MRKAQPCPALEHSKAKDLRQRGSCILEMRRRSKGPESSESVLLRRGGFDQRAEQRTPRSVAGKLHLEGRGCGNCGQGVGVSS